MFGEGGGDRQCPIPKGLCPPAQGCLALACKGEATLVTDSGESTPRGVVTFRSDGDARSTAGRNLFEVEFISNGDLSQISGLAHLGGAAVGFAWWLKWGDSMRKK
jgi:hypothetical protein